MRIPISALALAMALVAPAALAQQSPPAAPHQQMRGPMGHDRGAGHAGMMPMMGMNDPTRHVEGRLAFIRAELAITEAQQPQWQAFADAFRANVKRMGEMHAAMTPGAMPPGTMTPGAMTPGAMTPGAMPGGGMMKAEHDAAPLPEKFERAEQHMTTHLEMLRSMKAPATQLYAVLSADQKKMADEIIRGPMGMRHRM